MEIKMIDLDKNVPEAKPLSVPSSTPQFSPLDKPTTTKPSAKLPLVIISFLLVAVAGVFTGAFAKSQFGQAKVSPELEGIQADIPQTGAKVGDIYGSADEKAFRDPATGVLDKGGFNGEGTHKLLRPGGNSQTVYLTSSTIDLDSLVGHQVTIWGETFKGQKVGWLMDVGRAKVEALNAPLPK